MTTVKIRKWGVERKVNYEMPEEEARALTVAAVLRQVERQGYLVAPGAEVKIWRFEKEPWEETIWGCDEEGTWFGDPRDYGLRATVKVIPGPDIDPVVWNDDEQWWPPSEATS